MQGLNATPESGGTTSNVVVETGNEAEISRGVSTLCISTAAVFLLQRFPLIYTVGAM